MDTQPTTQGEKPKRAPSLTKLEARRAALVEKLHQTQAAIQRAKAKRSASERTAARRQDARRKLLIGVAVLEAVAAGEVQKATVDGWCARFIKRKGERELLGLPALPQQEKGGAA